MFRCDRMLLYVPQVRFPHGSNNLYGLQITVPDLDVFSCGLYVLYIRTNDTRFIRNVGQRFRKKKVKNKANKFRNPRRSLIMDSGYCRQLLFINRESASWDYKSILLPRQYCNTQRDTEDIEAVGSNEKEPCPVKPC